MNETEIIKKIAKYLFLTRTEVGEALDYITGEFTQELKKGKRIYVRNFGSLAKVKRKARRVRNPETKKIMIIPTRYTVKFTPSKGLQEKMNPVYHPKNQGR